MQTDADKFQPGQIVDGYRIVRRLGRGGMAEVYEAEAVKTGAAYALKVFSCRQTDAVFLKKRFLAEGRLLVKLRHPRIVGVHDFGFTGADETPYYVMDLVLDETGRPCTLRDAIQRGLSSEERIVLWYGDLTEALKYIHGKGVVHRDVSLENVLVGADGRAVLSDFGVSKVIDRNLRAELDLSLVTMVTNGRPLMGKAFYIAPEVRAGKDETAASDLYSLGVLFFYLLTQTWYAPGGRVADLLALFDEQWQKLLPELLADEPSARRAPAWQTPVVEPCAELREEEAKSTSRSGGRSRRIGLAALLALFLGGGLGAWGGWAHFVRGRQRAWEAQIDRYCPVHENLPNEDFSFEDLKESVWVVRGIVGEGLKRGVLPGKIADQLGELDLVDIDPPASAALLALIQQARILLYLDAAGGKGDLNRAREVLDDIGSDDVKTCLQRVIEAHRPHTSNQEGTD